MSRYRFDDGFWDIIVAGACVCCFLFLFGLLFYFISFAGLCPHRSAFAFCWKYLIYFHFDMFRLSFKDRSTFIPHLSLFLSVSLCSDYTVSSFRSCLMPSCFRMCIILVMSFAPLLFYQEFSILNNLSARCVCAARACVSVLLFSFR